MVTVRAATTAARLDTGTLKRRTIGMPTPTVWPSLGRIVGRSMAVGRSVVNQVVRVSVSGIAAATPALLTPCGGGGNRGPRRLGRVYRHPSASKGEWHGGHDDHGMAWSLARPVRPSAEQGRLGGQHA